MPILNDINPIFDQIGQDLSALPVVSVIIPSYKRHADLVKRAVASVQGQTYLNTEIIVIDDNGSDHLKNFRNELEAAFAQDENVVYLQNERNLGGALARNRGIEAARGEYIAFLDDDDRYLPDKVRRQLEFMLQNDLDMSFTDLKIFDQNERLIDYREHSRLLSFEKEELLAYHLTMQIAGTDTFMYRKSALESIGGFNPAKVGQEYYLMYKTISKNLKVGYLPGSDVILYRAGQECISNGPNKIIGEKELYKFKKRHFKLLTGDQKRYIRFRHNIVLAVGHKRNKNYFFALTRLAASFMASPVNFFKEAMRFLKKREFVLS